MGHGAEPLCGEVVAEISVLGFWVSGDDGYNPAGAIRGVTVTTVTL